MLIHQVCRFMPTFHTEKAYKLLSASGTLLGQRLLGTPRSTSLKAYGQAAPERAKVSIPSRVLDLATERPPSAGQIAGMEGRRLEPG